MRLSRRRLRPLIYSISCWAGLVVPIIRSSQSWIPFDELATSYREVKLRPKIDVLQKFVQIISNAKQGIECEILILPNYFK